MNENKILQISPAPANLLWGFDGHVSHPVVCLALVELSSGDREIHAMGLTNCEIIEDLSEAGSILMNE